MVILSCCGSSFAGANPGDFRTSPEGLVAASIKPRLIPAANLSIRTNPIAEKAFASVTGRVLDEKGEALIGVSVLIKGTAIGTNTDVRGDFKLEIPAGTTNPVLVFSFVGYTSIEVPVLNKTNIPVKMEPLSTSLDELVVVGYGVQKKESVVGAIAQVGAEAIFKSGVSTITNAIAGKLSGVLTIQNSGEPGANNSEIVVRGLSSWNGSAPLVLVDGVERDFKDLDPNEINTLSVLKDASATAVFGARGANGVIIVTTKRGALGKPKLDFSASFGMEKATRIPKHISSYTTLSMMNVARMNGQQFTDLVSDPILEEYRNPSSPLKALQYPDVNWFDLLAKPFAPTYNANINVQGGTNTIKYFLSLGYFHQGDFFKAYNEGFLDTRYKYDRINYRANVDFNLTKSTVLSLNFGGEMGMKNEPSASPWRNLYQTSTSRFPAYFPSWVLEQVPDLHYPDAKGDRLAMNFDDFIGNPYTTFHQGSFNRRTDSKLFTDLFLTQSLDRILKGLSVKGKVSLSTYYQNTTLTSSHAFPQYQMNYNLIGTDQNPWFRIGQSDFTYEVPPVNVNVGGMVLNDIYPATDVYYEASLNYGNTFGKHTVSALALANRQRKNAQIKFPFYNQAFVGRATYDFAGKYLAEFNIGYTGSERFAPGNRYGVFPSGAVGWVVSNEKFFQNSVPWMSWFKLRYSDGLVGSDYAANRWLYISDYFTDNRGYIHEDKGANFFAQWEQARKKDIGVEFGFFKDALTFNIDLFDEQRSKMLLEPRSVTMMVGNSFKELNLGKLKKHGIEIETEFKSRIGTEFNYFVKGIIGWSENRILFKDDPIYAPEYTKDAGKPLGAQVSGLVLTGSGYYTSIDDIHNNVAPVDVAKVNVGDYKFLDYTADGAVTVLDKYPIKGQTYAPFTYSLSGGFTYKNWSFNLMFQGNKGKYVEFNQTYEVEFVKGVQRVHTSQLDYWTPTNPNANHSTLHFSGQGNADIFYWAGGSGDDGYDGMLQDRFWRRADYLRLRDVYIGYNLQSPFLKRVVGVANVLVFATGNNLWTVTPLIEGDPERKDFNQGFYPQMSTVKLGIRFGL